MNAGLEVNPTQLRNFHKAHFRGQSIPLFRETSTVLPDSSTLVGQEDDDDEKLGWYHDGVKRTLTDEQITIFRHSEVQRLLQQRRLNADLADGHPDAQANEESKQSKQGRRDKKTKRPSKRAALQSENVELDYGQEGEMPASEPEQGESKIHHRKVVRYMEEADQRSVNEEADRPSRETSASQSFHWPKLGS